VSPEADLWAPVVDAAIDEAAGKVRDEALADLRKRIRLPR
jgi:hypothetical protein